MYSSYLLLLFFFFSINQRMKVKSLFALLSRYGVSFNRASIVDKADLINLLINSGRVVVVEEEGEGGAEKVAGIDDVEEGGEGGGGDGWVMMGGEGGEEEIGGAGGEAKTDPLPAASAASARSQSPHPFALGSTGLRPSDMLSMPIRELKRIAREGAVDLTGCVEKAEIVERIEKSGTVLVADY